MQRFFTAFLIIILAAFGYFYRAPLLTFADQLYARVVPCTRPITYSLGAIDPRFGISSSSVITSLDAAARVWNAAAGRTLFTYKESGGEVTVNFVYDDRQQTAMKLKSLGFSITSDKASYDVVNAEYQKLLASYTTEKAEFDAQNTAFERDAGAYEAAVRAANKRGGATPEEYAQLQQEKAALASRQAALLTLQKKVNADADDVNAIVATLNRLATLVNADASSYNSAAGGEEFEEADYEQSLGSERINVFEYDSTTRLTRVLSHELGHALGLDHVDDPDAIMYRLNQSKNALPTAADKAELSAVCHLK